MEMVSEIAAAREAAQKLAGPRVLVPTMGALHAGHEALIRRARELAGEGGSVLVSIFVNPIQFNQAEDLSRYPKPREADLALCAELGVELVFAPEPSSMYAADHSTFIDENTLAQGLCGATRPGHFRGVCTVVAKLFLILQPQIAVFGEKDYQQLAIIRRMVRDLHFPVDIVSAATVREPDGLALSSRNRFLSAEERAAAPKLQAILQQARAEVAAGEKSAHLLLERASRRIVEQTGARIDYISLIHAETLGALSEITAPAVIALAVFLGNTRLIDNLRLL